MSHDYTDVIARAFFGFLFFSLGLDLLLSGDFHMDVLPWWIPTPGITIIGCGMLLILGGTLIILGVWLQIAAVVLGFFLAFSITGIYLPGFMDIPVGIRVEAEWLWFLLLKSNLMRDLSLLGACIYLFNHELGKFSLEVYLRGAGIELTPWRKAQTETPPTQNEPSSSL
jgi:uncharacterized membrane protein YphA (DoxX/SURF4 family)